MPKPKADANTGNKGTNKTVSSPIPNVKKAISDKARRIPKQPFKLSKEALDQLQKKTKEKKKDAP